MSEPALRPRCPTHARLTPVAQLDRFIQAIQQHKAQGLVLAPGGLGNMIGGFALVAWPAGPGETGIMTFIVNQQGRVYQKNLGPKTTKIAETMMTYDPDKTWTVSRD